MIRNVKDLVRGFDLLVHPREEMEQLYAATSEPKEIRWYDAGHELGERSKDERLAWLGRELALK